MLAVEGWQLAYASW